MRALALMAFFALQLSVFTCGFDIHVHAAGIDSGHIAEHVHASGANHEQGSHNHGCHVHASHTFSASESEQHEKTVLVATFVHQYALADLSLKELPLLIEHPPKSLHS
ncbi:MAG: hypothetical protein Q9M20_04370 [Mariprofundaceae bacterium]|nr:hypothetical protein [Mariprofundaceae bacterium]